MRRIKAYYPAEQMLDRAVPFYLYVPKAILKRIPWRFEATRPGSHKDIFPMDFRSGERGGGWKFEIFINI